MSIYRYCNMVSLSGQHLCLFTGVGDKNLYQGLHFLTKGKTEYIIENVNIQEKRCYHDNDAIKCRIDPEYT